MDLGIKYENDTASFNLGQLNSYITSEITDRISFLSETTFTFKGAEAELEVEVERVIIKYQVDNYFNLHIGLHHTPIGYWNTAYHHGTVLQPTINRPLVFSFGGMFPIHAAGLLLSGDFIGKNKFGYDVMISNGIGSTNLNDNDRFKSITMSIHAAPIEGLRVGLSNYLDRIASGVINKQGTALINRVNQNLITGSLIYLNNNKPYEFISEYVSVQNKIDSENKFNSNSGFVYAGYKLENWVPYYRFDFLYIDNNDPYYITDDKESHIIGIRYSFSFISNIKFEHHINKSEQIGTTNLTMLQFAIGF